MTGVDELLKADAAAVLQLLDEANTTGERYPGEVERAIERALRSYRMLAERHDEAVAIYCVLSSYTYPEDPDVLTAAVAKALYAAERADRDARIAARAAEAGRT